MGSAGLNGVNQDQLQGNTYIVGMQVNASNVWNGNDWKGTGSPWTNLGNVCSAF